MHHLPRRIFDVRVEVQQPGTDEQVRGRRHRQEFGQTLDDTEDRRDEPDHRGYEARARLPCFRAGAAGAAGAIFIGLRPCQMTTMAAAMNTLE